MIADNLTPEQNLTFLDLLMIQHCSTLWYRELLENWKLKVYSRERFG